MWQATIYGADGAPVTTAREIDADADFLASFPDGTVPLCEHTTGSARTGDLEGCEDLATTAVPRALGADGRDGWREAYMCDRHAPDALEQAWTLRRAIYDAWLASTGPAWQALDAAPEPPDRVTPTR